MNNYNRQNPFMYLMETKKTELVENTEKCLSKFIRLALLVILNSIVFGIVSVGYRDITYVGYIFLNMILTIFIFYEIYISIQSAKNGQVNKMIFGDEYKDINVNNEKLLAMINDYNVNIGKTVFILEMIYYIIILELIQTGVLLVLILKLIGK